MQTASVAVSVCTAVFGVERMGPGRSPLLSRWPSFAHQRVRRALRAALLARRGRSSAEELPPAPAPSYRSLPCRVLGLPAPRRNWYRLLTCQGDARRTNELSVEGPAVTRSSSYPPVRAQGSRLWHPEQVWQLRSARTLPSLAPPPSPARPWASPLRPGSPWGVGCGLGLQAQGARHVSLAEDRREVCCPYWLFHQTECFGFSQSLRGQCKAPITATFNIFHAEIDFELFHNRF